jgi:HTH-type transcriptional regulator / antitoxin HipB
MDYTIRNADQLKITLKSFRKAKKLSQKELAARLGITQQAMSSLEAQPHAASIERLMQLLSVLGIDVVLRERDLHKAIDIGAW